MNLLFISDIVNVLLKTNSKRLKIPNFVIFVIWSTLIIGGGWGQHEAECLNQGRPKRLFFVPGFIQAHRFGQVAKRKGSISLISFYGQLPDYFPHVLALLKNLHRKFPCVTQRGRRVISSTQDLRVGLCSLVCVCVCGELMDD